MSKEIDERVVEMRFDNQQFERGVKTTMSTLDKLKQSLNLTGASKGLEGLEKSANRCDLSGLSNAVQSVGNRFSAMEVMAVTALANITNSAVNAGKRMISALTIDPIKTGYNEYELKMGSIQTIMAGTGESLATVNKYLAELNAYSDRTIYSFADMTSNIGKFTNAGVKLEDAVAAIKGVSNVAAVSGANANEASRAMYNFAQALSAGYVKLIDWKSIENANMATVEFKNYLLEAAVAEGTLQKTTDGMYKTLDKGTIIDATHNFNDSLQEQWMTTDALVSTLKAYADETTEIGKKAYASAQDVKTFSQLFDTLKEAAQSGWASTWETVVGDFEEAKALLTDINNVVSEMIGKSADLRNDVLTGWKDAGGRTAVIDAFRNAFAGLESIVIPIQEAFREIFPRTTSKQLVAFSKALKELTAKMKVSDETAADIKSTFKGLFSFLHIGVEAFKAIARGAKDLVTYLLPASKGLLSFTGTIGGWITTADEAISESDIFTKAFERIKDALTIVSEKINTSIGKITDSVSSFIETADPIKKISEVVGGAITVLGNAFKKAGPFFSEFGTTLGKAFSGGTFAGLMNLFNGGALAALIMGLKSLVGSFKDISDNAGGFVKGITDILGGVKGSLKAFQSELNSKTLMNIAAAIGILAVSLAILAAIDPSKLGGALIGITTLFAELMASLTMLSKTVGRAKFKSILKVIPAMIGLSVAILLLSVAMAKLSQTDWGGLAKGLVGIASLSAILITVSKKLSDSSGQLIKASAGLIVFGVAIRVLVSSVSALGKLDTKQLLQGLLSITALCTGLMLFLKYADLGNMGIQTGVGLMAMAIGVGILAHAVKTLAGIDEDKLVLGMTSLGIVLTELILFVKLLEGTGGLASTAAAIGILGVSMIIFAKAIEKMGSMDYKVLAAGLVGMAFALAEITIALKFMPKNMVGIGFGLMAMSAGLILMAKALEIMGGMSLWGMIKGLVALGASLFILSVAVNAMTGALGGAAALAVVTVALMGLAVALKMIGSMPLGNIVKSLFALVGVFVILGVASAALSALLPTMLLLGGALIVLGLGLAAVGAAALLLSIGFGSLSVSGLAGVAVLLGITAALIPLTALTPNIILVAGALAIFAVGIIALGFGLSALTGGLALLVALGPSSFETLVSLASTASQVAEFTLQMLAAGAGLLVFGAGALVAGAGALMAGVGIASLGMGLGVLAKVDLSNIVGVSDIAVDLLGASVALLAATPGLLAGGAALVVFGSGAESTATGLGTITTNISKVVAQVSEIPTQMDAACTAIVNAINAVIDEVKSAMKKRQPEIVDEVESVVDASVKAIKGKKNDYKLAGAYLVDGFIEGIKSKVSLAANSAAYMASEALKAAKARLDINSPSGEFEDVGMYADLGLAKGLKKYASVASQAATSVGEGAIRPVMDMNKSMQSNRSAMKSLQNMTRSADVNPVIETRKTTTVRHTFDKLVVEGVNDRGEFVAAADYAVEEVLANMMRRQSRI